MLFQQEVERPLHLSGAELFERLVGEELQAPRRDAAQGDHTLAQGLELGQELPLVVALEEGENRDPVSAREPAQEMEHASRPRVAADVRQVGRQPEDPRRLGAAARASVGREKPPGSGEQLEDVPIRARSPESLGEPGDLHLPQARRRLPEAAPDRQAVVPRQPVAVPGQEEYVRGHELPVPHVLPEKEELVAPDDGFELGPLEAPVRGGPVLVVDHRLGREEHLPSDAPGAVAQVGVLDVDGGVERIEAAELEELPAVEGRGAAARPERRVVAAREAPPRQIDMRVVDHAAAKARRSLPGLLAARRGVLQEHLARDGEGAGRKPFDQRSDEPGIDRHVVVEQDHDVVAGRSHSRVVPFGEAEVVRELEEAHLGKRAPDVLDRTVLAPVVDDQDLVAAAVAADRFDHRREALGQELPAVPVQDHDRGAPVARGLGGRGGPAGGARHAIDEIEEQEHRAQHRDERGDQERQEREDQAAREIEHRQESPT